MRRFSVLDRDEKIRQHTLLEASAGTGKTFSIENLVVRLIVEEEPIALEQILLVTFTRAATRELRERVRSNLMSALAHLESPTDEMPDYLKAVGPSARRRLSDALFAYDEAQIFTIHGFCSRMLRDYQIEGGVAPVSGGEVTLPTSEVLQVIRDFFRTELTSDLLLPAQLKILLKAHRGCADRLSQALMRVVTDTAEVAPQTVAIDLFVDFQNAVTGLSVSSEKLLTDFIALAPSYKKVCNRQGEILPELLEAVTLEANILAKGEWTISDFEALLKSGLQLIAATDPSRRKARAKQEPPALFELLRERLGPIVKEATSPNVLFALVSHHCQKMVRRVFEEKEWLSPDLLLEKMAERVGDPKFASTLRDRYSAVIVDEFQDTDPLQWRIFNGLFLQGEWPGFLYLVGDPKQSIYAFRQADIYTYLSAATRIGKGGQAALDTNYRSTPALIAALNELLVKEDLLPLPRTSSALSCPAVRAPEGAETPGWSDGLGAIHFMIGRGKRGRGTRWPSEDLEERFFSYVAGQMIALNSSDAISFGDMAVLVRDRYEASRLSALLKKGGIPHQLRRDRVLTETIAYEAVLELLAALISPKDLSALKVVLGGPLFQWTNEQMQVEEHYESEMSLFVGLNSLWIESGFSAVMEAFFLERGEKILASNEELYRDLQQLVEVMATRQTARQLTPEQLQDELKRMSGLDAGDDPALRCRQEGGGDSVQIMTIHMSKGLEFEVVFALGLVTRSSNKEKLVRAENGLHPFNLDEATTQSYLSELDAEKMRQLYVAMTRAKRRLYLPLALADDEKEPPSLGESSAMDLYWKETVDIEEGVRQLTSAITYEKLPEEEKQHSYQQEKSIPILQPPPIPSVEDRSLYMHSFTSLAKVKHQLLPEQSQVGYTLHTMPRGASTGVILHELLERLPFSQPEAMEQMITDHLQGSSLELWIPVLQNALQVLTTMPLPMGFSLSQIDQITREMPFLLREKSGRFLKGSIDMIVEVENKLYLIDWKSNWLGSSAAAYGREQIEAAMESHDYTLQANIYTAALKQYVEEIEKGNFEERFGGALYVFLRGVESGQGIHFLDPMREGALC